MRFKKENNHCPNSYREGLRKGKERATQSFRDKLKQKDELLREAIEVIRSLDGFVNECWAIDMDIGNEFLNRPEIKQLTEGEKWS